MKKTILQKTRILSILCLLMAWIGMGNAWGQTGNPTPDNWINHAEASWAGEGTAENPYQITSADELAGLAEMINNRYDETGTKDTSDPDLDTRGYKGKFFKLTSNINLGGKQWTPIGTDYDHSFKGTFDGGGNTISSLTINSNAQYIGLFGFVGSGGKIQNLGLIDSNITGNHNGPFIGGIAGQNDGTIMNCYNTGNVTGTSDENLIGGIAGKNRGTIMNCYNTGSVTGTGGNIGGIEGNNDGTIMNCYNTGSVTGTGGNIGGIAGYYSSGVYYKFDNCYNTGSVSGSGPDAKIGGIVGILEMPYDQGLDNCYNTGSVSGSGEKAHIGGIAGLQEGAYIINCYNTGNVSGTGTDSKIGGIDGTAKPNMDSLHPEIKNCYNTGNVTGIGTKGGIVGNKEAGIFTNNHYLEGRADKGVGEGSDANCSSIKDTDIEGSMNEAGFTAGPWKTGAKLDDNILIMPQLKWAADKKIPAPKVVVRLKKEGDIYKITCIEELRFFRDKVNKGNSFEGETIQLDADIDLTGENWEPIGWWKESANCPFKGTFDGDGKTISNLTINSDAKYVGLFGFNIGTIQNLGLIGSHITGNAQNNQLIGGIAGENVGPILGCYNTGSVKYEGTGTNVSIGGIAGRTHDGITTQGDIRNCYNTGSVTGNGGFICGIVGDNGSVIWSCYNTGSVTGNGGSIGGIAGDNDGESSIWNCYNTGSVTGNGGSIGGIVGKHVYGSITNCHYLNGTAAQGIAGQEDYEDVIKDNVNAFVKAMKDAKDFYEKPAFSTENGWKGTAKIENNKLSLPYLGKEAEQPFVQLYKVTVDVKVDDAPSTANWTDFITDVTPAESYIEGATITLKTKDEINAANADNSLFDIELYEFLSWGKVPVDNVMPAKDVSVTACFKSKIRKITVTPDAGQVLYKGDDYNFTYSASGAAEGETPAFKGSLGCSNGVITKGNLELIDNGKFKAANYTLVVNEVSYAQSDRKIEEVLNEALNEVTFEGTEGDNGWYVGDNFTITAPAGFEVGSNGYGWGYQIKTSKQGLNEFKIRVRRDGGSCTSDQVIGKNIWFDNEAPKIQLVKTQSLKAILNFTDEGSGIRTYTINDNVQPQTKSMGYDIIKTWRGQEGVNHIRIKVRDDAGNETVREFDVLLTYQAFDVTVPEVDFAQVSTGAGTFSIEEGESFTFKLNPLGDTKLENIKVTANGQELIGSLGVYQINEVVETTNIQIVNETPTGNEAISINKFSVRAQNSTLYIACPSNTRVQISDFNGRVIRSFEAPAGESQCNNLGAGIYIVKTKFGIVKVRMK